MTQLRAVRAYKMLKVAAVPKVDLTRLLAAAGRLWQRGAKRRPVAIRVGPTYLARLPDPVKAFPWTGFAPVQEAALAQEATYSRTADVAMS